MRAIGVLAFLIIVSFNVCIAQTPERIARNANAFFEDNLFEEALPLYLQIKDQCPTEIIQPDELAFRTAICFYNLADKRSESIPFFEKYVQTTHKDSNYQAHFLLGQLYQEHYRFEEALEQFRIFSEFVDKDTETDRQTIFTVKNILAKRIENCNYGKLVYQSPRQVIIENLGEPINTKYSEYAPVITSDETKIVFTRRSPDGGSRKVSPDGDYYEDVFIADIVEGSVMKKLNEDSLRAGFINVLRDFKLTDPVSLKNINTASYDGAVQFSYTADKLYVYRKNNVWVSSLQNGEWQKPELISDLATVLDQKAFEPSVSITMDGSALYFSSDRPGGYGGLDLYRSKRTADGKWSAPENLGEAVNTPFDEDSPYIDPDNRSLYFSSKGHSSMGGFDVFKTILEKDRFYEVNNLGFPVNSPGDDIFFMMTPKYNRGYYASNKSGGKGKMDIYRITFADERKSFAEVKGLVLKGDKLVPARSKVTLFDPNTSKEMISVRSDSISGDYLLLVGHGKKYTMHVETEGFVPFSKMVSIPEQMDFFQYYQEVHHVHIKDKNGNVIGQLITMYTTNGDSIQVDRDSVFQEEFKSPFIYEVLAAMNRDSLNVILSKDSTLYSKYKLSADKEQFLFDLVGDMTDKQLMSLFAKDPGLIYKIQRAKKYGYKTIADAKFYISRDSLIALMKNDPSLQFKFPKNTSISFFDIRKAQGKFNILDPDLYVLSEGGFEAFSVAQKKITPEKLKEVFKDAPPSETIPKVLVLFEFKENDLSDDARSNLDVFSEFMHKNPSLKFEIVGHTDSVGSESFNEELSLKRASAAVNYLRSKGIKANRLRSTGAGRSQPIANNTNPDGSDSPEGRRMNRRVEFILFK